MELGIPYELVHPDGTRVVFGNSDIAKADVDWIGPLDPEQGIAGLDSPDLKEVAQDVVQGHGGLHLDFFHGRRPIVINSMIDPNVAIGTSMQREQKVKRASNATDAATDAALKWTNSGGFPKRRLLLRRQPGLRIVGRRPKTILLPMVDADWRIQSDAENASAVTAHGVNLNIANAGDVVASPRIRAVATAGGLGAPIVLRNVTAGGLEVKFKPGFALAAGQVLVVNLKPPWPTVTVNGVDAYGQVDFLPTDWWGLVPGNNLLQLQAGTANGTFQVFWRDAWI